MGKTTFLEAYLTAYKIALKEVTLYRWQTLEKRIRHHLKNIDKLKELTDRFGSKYNIPKECHTAKQSDRKPSSAKR